MVIISATGGSGSTFINRQFKHTGWNVCLRPDVGFIKDTVWSYANKRTHPYFKLKKKDYTLESLFETVYNGLARVPKCMLMSMVWGTRGLLLDKTRIIKIYIIRNPIYTYNSYVKPQHLNGRNINDKEMVDWFFKENSRWLDQCKYALEDKCYVVRYERFHEDWAKIPKVPKISKWFTNRNHPGKLQVNEETAKYIIDLTKDVWEKICQL